MSVISRNVWILSWVSLFTDIASEMLYPVMPGYLRHIGFSIFLIGILEGVAEATAGLSKGYFGQWSDRLGRRMPFVRAGYGLSAVAKPLLAVSTWPWWIFGARTLDRLGKGLRTGARDALLSDEATPETKGAVFGFHRSLDTVGAFAGPVFALLFLHFFPGRYVELFLLAFVPGVLAIVFTWLIKEKKRETRPKSRPGWLDFIRWWKQSPAAYRRVAGALLLFALFNSSDVFLLLRLRDSGVSDTVVIGAYIFYNAVYALFAWPLGRLADRIGMRLVLSAGLLVFALVYAGMSFGTGWPVFAACFLLYGLYAAATEGVAKAWLSNLCDPNDTATAIGAFTAFQSIGALIASSVAGWLWYQFGAEVTFGLTAAVAAGVGVFVWRQRGE